MARLPKVYILILNYNGWLDTIECLESVFRNNYPNFQVVVCDNCSSNNSYEYIKTWAEGKLDVMVPQSNPLLCYSFPPIPKPIPYIEYERVNAEAGGTGNDNDVPLVLIQTGANLGFAGGNNVGLRYILGKENFDYVWLLNNDTVIEPDSLTQLVNRVQQEQQSVGICGSTLRYYNKPEVVQALGGARYNKWLGVIRPIGMFQAAVQPIDFAKVERMMSYVLGASMFVSREFLLNIGLMSEVYFLYFEELDWAMEAQGQYKLIYASKSIIYHKEGSSIGSSSKPREKSLISDYYSIRNKFVFTRKFFPYALPTIYLGLLIVVINRIRRRQWERLILIKNILTGEKLHY